ncbi:MAG: hypothetical protein P8177_13675 [Gemmatimonadota bacterium]
MPLPSTKRRSRLNGAYRTFRYRFPLDGGTPEGERAGDIAMSFRETGWRLSGRPDPP